MCGDGPSPNGRLFAPECVLDADGFLVRGSHAVGNWLVHEFVEREVKLIQLVSVATTDFAAIDGYLLDHGFRQNCLVSIEVDERRVVRISFVAVTGDT
jgi:hypothetical protein